MTAVIVPPGLDHDGIHVRRAVVEGVTDEGLVECKIAPYEHEVELVEGSVYEVFTRGAFAAACGNPSRIKVSNQGHDRSVIIGHAVELRDESDGIYGKLRIADTSHGRDVLALFRAESLNELSVEFRPQRKYWRKTTRPGGGELWRHDRAVLVGVSPVGAGAYGDEARVLAVREAARTNAQEQAIARLRGLTSGPKRG
jgi:HK97 family phage prohead protease